MRNLIFADVHEDVDRIDRLRKAVPHDRVYCLGDWADTYRTSSAQLTKTIEYIKANPEIESVLGNHDIPYFFGGRTEAFYTPGYTRERGFVARRALGPSYQVPFKLHHWVDGWLLSHAGVHPYLLRGASTPSDQFEVIEYACAEAMKCLHDGRRHFMTGWGADRGGVEQRVGGITWLDWNSFQAIPGLNQLVGHTFTKEVRKKETAESINFCIDTGLRHYAIIEDGKLEIFLTEDAIGKKPKKTRKR